MSVANDNLISMKNGTYQKQGKRLVRVNATTGYWVGIEETTIQAADNGDTIGVWTEPKTGKVWIDRVIHLDDLTLAVGTARLNNQLAIYDVSNKKEIYLEGN